MEEPDVGQELEESNPNAGGKDQLAGDMGVSSERVAPSQGVEGTGTVGNARAGTNGTQEAHCDAASPEEGEAADGATADPGS